MKFSKPVTDLIRQRYSCRTYTGQLIPPDIQAALKDFIYKLPPAPFESHPRLILNAGNVEDNRALKGLGTYGMIRNPAGFLIGAAGGGMRNLEDFGYLMEAVILRTTDLGLGTCWLGGNFKRSTFSERIRLRENEILPAVCSIGITSSAGRRTEDLIGRLAASNHRLGWERLFFDRSLNNPLSPGDSGVFAGPLEMIRSAPSASNKQPWRIIRNANHWHFYLKRTSGYGSSVLAHLLTLADLQRVDMGIAMCHFDLSSAELGMRGHWVLEDPGLVEPDHPYEYCSTWLPA
jgi:nitroreductase